MRAFPRVDSGGRVENGSSRTRGPSPTAFVLCGRPRPSHLSRGLVNVARISAESPSLEWQPFGSIAIIHSSASLEIFAALLPFGEVVECARI